MNYDIIGDIHGQDQKLEGLLLTLGYAPTGNAYRAPLGRQAIFLGDLIDRGPGQQRVLRIVKTMVDNGDARCIMGNHELNAIGFATPDPANPGEFLRPNQSDSKKSRKNREQHAEFIRQMGEGSAEHLAWVEWFKTLPVCLDLNGIRVVHGCWEERAVQTLRAAGWVEGQKLDGELLLAVYQEDTPVMKARELLTCGLEVPLPKGRLIQSKDGHEFGDVRIANWRHWANEFHEVALVPKGQEDLLMGLEWPAELVISEIKGSPIFVGHHWFSGHPMIESPKLACLDWSAAKDGPLVAYQWDGETELNNDKLMWVGK